MKILRIILTLMIALTACKTTRHAAQSSVTVIHDTITIQARIETADTATSDTEKITFSFDTVTAPPQQRIDDMQDLILWATTQKIKTLEIQYSQTRKASQTRTAAQAQNITSVTQNTAQHNDITRKTDTTAMWGLYLAAVIICCVALFLIYRYFGGR